MTPARIEAIHRVFALDRLEVAKNPLSKLGATPGCHLIEGHKR